MMSKKNIDLFFLRNRRKKMSVQSKENINNSPNTEKNKRHILGLSGGKDSTALAIHIMQNYPDIHEKIEYYFTDTGEELPEIYTYLELLEQYLGKKIQYIKADMNEDNKPSFRVSFAGEHDERSPFEVMLFDRNKGYLPSPQARWCTRQLKIEPMEKWIGSDHCISYIGIRADENRTGYNSNGKKNTNITGVYPFQDDNITIQDVFDILNKTVGMPDYYKWKTRSGCTFCYYQRRVEFAVLYFLYPNLFEDAKKYETNHADGRSYTWIKDKPLKYIEDEAKAIMNRYVKKQYKKLTEEELSQMVYTDTEIYEFIKTEQIHVFIDAWDLYRLHNAGHNEAGKDGCAVCAI